MSIVASDVNKVIRKQVGNICTLNCSAFCPLLSILWIYYCWR